MTPLPKDQAIIDAYATGASYKKVARQFRRDEHRIKTMIAQHAPDLMRSRGAQIKLTAGERVVQAFCPADLGLVPIGPCTCCEIPLVGKVKTARQQTCGLCEEWMTRAA